MVVTGVALQQVVQWIFLGEHVDQPVGQLVDGGHDSFRCPAGTS